MRIDRFWISTLLATMRIVPGMDDYIDDIEKALQDRGRTGVEQPSEGGYDVDIPDDIWFGLVSRGIAKTTLMADDSWAEMLSDVRRSGLKAAQEYKEAGNTAPFEPGIVSAQYGKGGNIEKLASAKMPLDWTLAKRREMVLLARLFLAAAEVCGIRHDAYSVLLARMVEGRELKIGGESTSR